MGLRRTSGRDQLVVEKSIAAVLADVTPLLRIEHCRLALTEFVRASGLLLLRIEGNCPDCSGSPAMFAAAIEAHLKLRVPEVKEVRIS